jgi:hypothetical protein
MVFYFNHYRNNHLKFRLLVSLVASVSLSLLLVNSGSAAADFNFAAVGDWGCGSNAKNTEKNIGGKHPERVFQLGDYSYQSKASCWFKIIEPIDSKSRINIGNHDDDPKSLLNTYLKHFGLNKPYYSFDYQNVHVIVLNTEDGKLKKTSSEQYKFLSADLKKASQDSSIEWIIVSLHKPLFSSPNGCSASSCKGSASTTKAVQPLFDKYDVDLVLQGHVHNYQRTFPLKFNSGNPLKPIKTSTEKNDYTDPKGQIYAIVGTGGINFHTLSDRASFVSYQQAKKFGQLDLSFTDSGNKLTGTFYPNGGGASLDHFSITKNPKGVFSENGKSSGVPSSVFG